MARRVPAISIRAILEGLGALGLDERRLRTESGVPEQLSDPGALVPDVIRQRLWGCARRVTQRDTVAVETGMALPFGALGAMDYLAASADTLGASCEALERSFHSVSCERRLELEKRHGDYRIRLVVADTREDVLLGDEFTLGAMLNRFRARVDGFTVSGVQLRRTAPRDAGRFAEVFGAPVTFGHAVTALCLPARLCDARTSSSDPWLRRALESLVPRRGMGGHGSDLEQALRSAVRELLLRGELGASRVASSLGMSERSLQRRLSELGRSYRAVVEAVLHEEAERLLLDGVDVGEVSRRLGFADPSGLSRAFKRWAGLSPRAWLADRKWPGASRSEVGGSGQVSVGCGQARTLASI